MPIYTYECDECGVRFDEHQKFSDAPISECPECGGHTHRVPQPVGIVFKGSGWYVKDSGRQNNLATPKREGAADEAGSKSKEKSDTPAAAPAETKTSSASEAKTD
ncbi:MAG: zinc ribbon domain-containing protein [Chloroflexi bacterium]|nr:zinc ribbon domain-containing protein [Chloroflexota bacterium]